MVVVVIIFIITSAFCYANDAAVVILVVILATLVIVIVGIATTLVVIFFGPGTIPTGDILLQDAILEIAHSSFICSRERDYEFTLLLMLSVSNSSPIEMRKGASTANSTICTILELSSLT